MDRFKRKLIIFKSHFNFTTPYPGTTLYDEARSLGKIEEDETNYLERIANANINELTVNLTTMSDEELIALKRWADRELDNLLDPFKWKLKEFIWHTRAFGLSGGIWIIAQFMSRSLLKLDIKENTATN
jgi:hypothetical protein